MYNAEAHADDYGSVLCARYLVVWHCLVSEGLVNEYPHCLVVVYHWFFPKIATILQLVPQLLCR